MTLVLWNIIQRHSNVFCNTTDVINDALGIPRLQLQHTGYFPRCYTFILQPNMECFQLYFSVQVVC